MLINEFIKTDNSWVPATALAVRLQSPAVYVKQCRVSGERCFGNQVLFNVKVQITAVQAQDRVLLSCVCIDPRAQNYGLLMKKQVCKSVSDFQRFLKNI